MRRSLWLFLPFMNLLLSAIAQPQLKSVVFDHTSSFTIHKLILSDKKEIGFPAELPMFSILIDSISYDTKSLKPVCKKDETSFLLADSIETVVKCDKNFLPGMKYTIRFTNNGKGKHKTENLVPLGEGRDKVYI